jgi:hypothetical protein
LGESPVAAPAAKRRRLRGEHAVVAYVVVAIAALITVRSLVDALDFVGVGWILVLVALPLLPWILPKLGGFLKAISPYVQSLKLGALQLDFRTIERKPISVPSSGIFASVPNDVGALSSGTSIQQLLSALRDFRRKGAGPVVVIDLQDGHKWRLPNLYFLTRLLENEERLWCSPRLAADTTAICSEPAAPTTSGDKSNSRRRAMRLPQTTSRCRPRRTSTTPFKHKLSEPAT